MNRTRFIWPWNYKNPGYIDKGRLARAEKTKIISKVSNDDECYATFEGSGGAVYETTFSECTCKDFALSHGEMPCKHIIRLALDEEVINSLGNTEDQQRKADYANLREHIAKAYGYYYHFHEPIVSDNEYNAMKNKLQAIEKRL